MKRNSYADIKDKRLHLTYLKSPTFIQQLLPVDSFQGEYFHHEAITLIGVGYPGEVFIGGVGNQVMSLLMRLIRSNINLSYCVKAASNQFLYMKLNKE